jgi:hypothetical protein
LQYLLSRSVPQRHAFEGVAIVFEDQGAVAHLRQVNLVVVVHIRADYDQLVVV